MQRPNQRLVVAGALGSVVIAAVVRLATGFGEASPRPEEPTIVTTVESTSGHQLSRIAPDAREHMDIPEEYLRAQARETERLMRERGEGPAQRDSS